MTFLTFQNVARSTFFGQHHLGSRQVYFMTFEIFNSVVRSTTYKNMTGLAAIEPRIASLWISGFPSPVTGMSRSFVNVNISSLTLHAHLVLCHITKGWSRYISLNTLRHARRSSTPRLRFCRSHHAIGQMRLARTVPFDSVSCASTASRNVGFVERTSWTT